MADVFISYSSTDRSRAEALARALDWAGFTVWWDRDLLGGTDYGEVIREELALAAAVIVLWSQDAVRSDWVHKEARLGKAAGKLIPIRLDHAAVPADFHDIHVLDFSNWSGETDMEFRSLCRSIRGKQQKPAAETKSQSRHSRLALLAVSSFSLVALGLAATTSFDALSTFVRPNSAEAGPPIPVEFDLEGEKTLDRRAVRAALRMLIISEKRFDAAVEALVATGDFKKGARFLRAELDSRSYDYALADTISLLHQIGAITFNYAPEEAFRTYRELLEYAPDDRLALAQLARLYFSRGELEQARDYMSRATQLAAYSPEEQLYVDIDGARILSATPRLTVDQLKTIAKDADGLDQPAMKARALMFITSYEAYDFWKQNQTWTLTPDMNKAHAALLTEAIGLLADSEHFDDLSAAYHNLAEVRYELGDIDDAISLQQMAVELYELLQHRRDIGLSYRNLALFHLEAGDLGAAETSVEKAVAATRTSESFDDLSGHMTVLANIKLAKGERDEACSLLEKLESELGDPYTADAAQRASCQI